ncbi:sensor histidine kinase [Erythrobacter litoralis]|uniref:histidine kinase n=1 Tax=Erythrobacter litoralis (strain HTCC2594) TaxID=314225 RepID=Q2NBW9_ERYLH|nr:two-component signal transduction histidine kinase [Erythrobacter litoralis HTCC2594]
MDSATASTTRPTRRGPDDASDAALEEGAVTGAPDTGDAAHPLTPEEQAEAPHTGSLARRMMLISAAWILVLLLGGGIALDRTLTNLVERNFDEQLEYVQTALLSSAEIGPDGEVLLYRALGDQRFLEPNSGVYWQISGEGHEPFPSRSLWDRSLQVQGDHIDDDPHYYDSNQFADEPLRVVERSVILPGSDTRWTFTVASARDELDAQITRIRSILFWSFVVLAVGLLVLAALQSYYGLRPLRRVRLAIQRIRSTGRNRVTDPLPLEVQPLVEELNALLEHSEKQAEEARTHAGNLAHALKTPLTVLTNAATAQSPDLSTAVMRETRTMQRHVDHHLARARAVGRRAVGHARTSVWQSAQAVQRAVERLYPDSRFDIDGNKEVEVAIERQDLDEILGNLIENAAKYGGGTVFVTIDAEPAVEACVIWVEDDGTGIPEDERDRIFDRGVRLDTGKPGTGLGLAIVRDVAEIYGGGVDLAESEDLGGLLVRLSLPRAGQV